MGVSSENAEVHATGVVMCFLAQPQTVVLARLIT